MNLVKMNHLYMDIAVRLSEMSCAERKVVGAVLVKEDNIISFGWNGMPSGFDNCCEHFENNNLVTNNEVAHAELNIFAKLAKNGSTGTKGSVLYVTLSPCFECSKLIVQSGVSKVYYLEEYRDTRPLEFLNKAGVEVIKYE
jgi:dCMP deaminase